MLWEYGCEPTARAVRCGCAVVELTDLSSRGACAHHTANCRADSQQVHYVVKVWFWSNCPLKQWCHQGLRTPYSKVRADNHQVQYVVKVTGLANQGFSVRLYASTLYAVR
jgi:hypothetical protein